MSTMSEQHSQDAYGQYMLDTPISLDMERSQSQLTTPSSASDSSSILFGASHGGFASAANHGYTHHHHHQHTVQQPQPSSLGLTLDPSQLRTGSIGPNRVVTRRQARIAQESAAYSSTGTNRGLQNQRQQLFGDVFTWHAAPSDLSLSTIDTQQAFSGASPTHPSTPSSVSSGFSHYGFHPYASGPHGHSRSTSSTTNHRSASPAISIASVATSISSGNRSRAPISSGSASSVQTASKPKRRLTNKQRKEICQYYEDHPTTRQEDIAKLWDVERSTVSKILKNKGRWMQMHDDNMQDVAKSRSSKFPEIEAMLSIWLRECTEKKTPVSDVAIRTKAKEIAKNMCVGEDKFKASAGWVENFKHRNNIKKGIFQGSTIPNPDPSTFVPEEHETESYAAMMARRERDDLLRAVEESALREVPGQSTSLNIDVGLSHVPSTDGSAAQQTSPVQGATETQQSDFQTHSLPYHLDTNGHITEQPGLHMQHGVSQPGNALWGPIAHTPSSAANTRPAPAAEVPSVSAREAFGAIEQVMRFLAARPLNGLSDADNNLLIDLRTHIYAETARDARNAASARAAATASSQSAQAPGPQMLGMSAAIPAGAPTAAS